MTTKLKCPICGGELKHEMTTGIYCCKRIFADCPLGLGTGTFGTKELWQALIQAKQDLEIATKANDEIRDEYETYHGAEREGCFTINWEVVAKKMYNYANKALEQIEHKKK